MKEKKDYTLEDIKNESQITRIQGDSIITDIYGNNIDIIEATKQADHDIDVLKSGNVHFRWDKKEIERAKRIAEKKGLKYQTYIKSTLKQQMDKDEKDLGIAS